MELFIQSDSTDEILYRRKLADDEILDCDTFAREYWYESTYGELGELEISDLYVPKGCADFTVILTPFGADEPWHCWESKSYFATPKS